MMSTINRGWKQVTFAGLRCMAILTVVAIFSATIEAQTVQAVRPIPSATKVAGTGSHGFNLDSGTASSVELNAPGSNLFDSQGNQYISDAGNNCVRKVDTAGNISTVAGLVVSDISTDTCDSTLNNNPASAQGLLAPAGLALDTLGNLYIADTGHNCVRRLASRATGTANMVTAVGDCTQLRAAAILPAPSALAFDAAGNLYISTEDGAGISQVVEHRTTDVLATAVCLVAGLPSALVTTLCSGNSLPTLNKPSGIAFDPAGNLFIADTGNSCVREMTTGGVFSTPVGQCTNDGTGSSSAALMSPAGLAFSQTGKLFITDTATSGVYEFLMPGTLNLIAGLPSRVSGVYAASQEGGAGITVPLSSPQGVAVDPMGNVLVVDSGNNIVRKLAAGFRFPNTPVKIVSQPQIVFVVVTTRVDLTAKVGSDYEILYTDCNGKLAASPSSPILCEVVVEFSPAYPGSRRSPLTLTDAKSGKKFTWGLIGTGTGAEAIFPPGTIHTLLTSLASPAAVRMNSRGDIYFAEAGTVSDGDVKFMAFDSTTPKTLVPSLTGLKTPTALALDSAGNLYIADSGTNSIFEYDANGVLTTFASALSDPEGLAVDDFDNLYVAEAGALPAVRKLYAAGQQAVIAGRGSFVANGVPAVQASLQKPSGLALDNDGVLYLSDRAAHRVYSIGTDGYIHFLVGNGSADTDTLAGTALGIALHDPRDLAVDAAGDVYIADGTGNTSIVAYSAAQQNPSISTIAGTGNAGNTGDGGSSTTALLNNPISLALDGRSNIYIVDAGNMALREISYGPPTRNFGTIKAGDVSPAQTLTLWDTGNSELTQVAPLQLSDNINFSVDSSTQCGTIVHSGATCDYGFHFNPVIAGTYAATAPLTNDSYDSPQVITLDGVATDANTAPSTINVNATAYRGTYGTPYTWTVGVTGNGTDIPTGTLTFTIAGKPVCPPLPLGGSCSPSATGLAVGSYAMTISYSGDGIYAANSVGTTATIDPAPVTITADNASRWYGQPNPIFTGVVTGVVAGETITAAYSTTATQFSPVGTYPIAAVAAAGPGTWLTNYAITIGNGVLTITPAGPITVTVANATRIYGVPNPTFTSSILNAANNDTVTVTYSTTATLGSPVGTYPITAALGGAAASDYSGATIITGVLTIAPAPTALALSSSNSSPMTGTAVTFTAMVTSPSQIMLNGMVTFTDGGTPLATVTEDAAGTATFTTSSLTAGSHTITAIYPGTTNFLPSTANWPQAVATVAPISPAGGSFSITATPPYQEVKGAGSNVYQITLNSLNNFNGPVTLSCAGLPADAGCTFSPAVVTLTAGGSAATQLTTTTTLSDASTAALNLPTAGTLPLLAWSIFPLEFSGAATLLVAGVRGRKRGRLDKRLILILPLALMVLGLSGCGCTVTQFHTYTITISGVATSGGAPVSQTTTVTLSVIQ